MIVDVELDFNSNTLAVQVANAIFGNGDPIQVFWLEHTILPTLKRFVPLKLGCLHIRLLDDLVTTQDQRLNIYSAKIEWRWLYEN